MLGVYLFSSFVFDIKRLLIVYFENEFNKKGLVVMYRNIYSG